MFVSFVRVDKSILGKIKNCLIYKKILSFVNHEKFLVLIEPQFVPLRFVFLFENWQSLKFLISRMSYGKDLAAVLKGVQLVGRAVVREQIRQCERQWETGSLKSCSDAATKNFTEISRQATDLQALQVSRFQ